MFYCSVHNPYYRTAKQKTMWPLMTHCHTCNMNSCWSSISTAHSSPMPYCGSARSGRQGDRNIVTSLDLSKTVIKDLLKQNYHRNQFWKYSVGNRSPGNSSSSTFNYNQPMKPTDASVATNAPDHATLATTQPRLR